MEIINDDEEINKLLENSNFQIIKVCLIGIDNTGKTSLLDRIVYKKNFKYFKESIQGKISSISGQYHELFVKYKDKLFKLELLDIPGQLIYFSLIEDFYQDIDVILNFYDPFKKESFDYIKRCFQSISELNNPSLCTYIIIKNKNDLNETKDQKIMISDEEILEYADKNNLSFRNLSNLEKYSSGIEEIIEDCINCYIYKNNNYL